MTKEELFELMLEVEPETKRVPPGILAIANAIEQRIRNERATPAPSAPIGWKLVPVEPTERMIIDGFESAPSPNPSWTPMDVWDEYEAMSGCEQAAFRAKLCWAAMLAAAPTHKDTTK
jgi:hypothetical protein